MERSLKALKFVGLAVFAGLFVAACGDGSAWAQTVEAGSWRNQGMTICPIKLAILVFIYFGWLASTSWINNDAERLGDPDRAFWNGMNLISFAVGLLVALLVPIFWASAPIAILAWAIPNIVYVKARNKDMLDADKVMTAGHLAFWFRTKVLKQKVKPKPLPYEGGSEIQLAAIGKNLEEQVLVGRLFRSRQLNESRGYNLFRELLYHALHNRATEVAIEFGAEETKFQYQLDGVFHPVNDAFKNPWTREEADCVAEAAKLLIGVNPKDRRSRQSGMFRALYDKNKKGKPLTCDAALETVGTPTGEVFRVAFKFQAAQFRSLDEIGVSAERQAKMKELINADRGLVVLAAAPHQGLKTLTTVVFNTADRFTRDFATVEDVQNPYETIENIALNVYDSAKGETPMSVLGDVFFKEPKVVLVRDMGSVEAWKLCCDEVKNDRLIISTQRGKDAVAALIELLRSGVDKKALADAMTAVIAQKLARRLCEECREEIKPNPQVLKNLGLDPKTEKLWRKRTRPQVEPGQRDYYVPCEVCRDVGFIGRVAIFDVLEINDEMRRIIAADADLAAKDRALRAAAVKSGQRGFLVDGARLVRNGVTSFEELVRVLK